MSRKKVDVNGVGVTVIVGEDDYISLTDIARYKDSERSDYILQNWLRNRNTIEFIGLWEQLHNPDFKSIEFDGFMNQAGSNSFSLTPTRWIESTSAIGIMTKKGRYGGTYAHHDIALEFASWVSAEFKLYLLKEFKRLKTEESTNLEWSVSRAISKVNYKIHTDAIKEHIIPKLITKSELKRFVYADEADMLNLALFGKTAKQWRSENKDKKGNVRDYASLEQLVVLSNLESFNSELIKQGMESEQRFIKLNRIAVDQMKVMVSSKSIKFIK